MKIGCLIASLAFLLSATAGAEEEATFKVRFGVVEYDSASREKVIRETSAIPFRDCRTGAAYGYSVEHNAGRRFSTHAVFYPPSPVKKVDEGLWGTAETSPTTGLTADSLSFVGKGISEFCFTDSDPRGEWKAVIFINAVRFSAVAFQTAD